jgi:hypothetical protein
MVTPGAVLARACCMGLNDVGLDVAFFDEVLLRVYGECGISPGAHGYGHGVALLDGRFGFLGVPGVEGCVRNVDDVFWIVRTVLERIFEWYGRR